MSASPSLSINNVLSFNGHGGKVTSGSNKTFTLPNNVYVLVPFGIGVDLPSGQTKNKTDNDFKGLDVCYGFPDPEGKKQSFEEIIYGKDGKLKLTFKNSSSNDANATWHLYKPHDVVPNVNYFPWKDGDTGVSCDDVSNKYKNFVSHLMKHCLDSKSSVCALFVSNSDTNHDVFTDNSGNYHLKLKICGDASKVITTLEELAENCHDLVNISRKFVKTKKKSGETYDGYDDDKIFPKSNKTTDPIILLPFSCNSCGPGKDIDVNHTNAGDAGLTEPLSKIIADLSGGGGESASAPPLSGKVAQFFMTFLSKDRNNGGLNSSGQCKKIVNAVKCLMAKGYKNIGLTYSANQAQTIKIWEKYKYDVTKDYDWISNNFDNDQPKTIAETEISGDHQAEVLGPYYKKKQNEKTGKWEPVGTELPPRIDTLTKKDEDFKKAFRIIPFTTMKYASPSSPAEDLDNTTLGKVDDCIKAAEDFLKLPNSIILGWCNQGCAKMTDKTSSEQKFAIGGGVAGGLSDAKNLHIPAYLNFLQGEWDPIVQKIVTDCSPNPKSADSTASSTSTPSPSKVAPSKPLDDVIKDLIAGIINTEDPEAKLSALSITKPSGGLVYKYPPPLSSSSASPPSSPPPTPPVTEDKNLNSAEPTIDDMIKGFEDAKDGGDTKFYLGACRSIKAAYDLEMLGIVGSDTSADLAKMRAKLLLNLRKNSLLLKVPRRWNYATMKLVEVPPQPTELNALMGYSLQDTIEYYSEVTGDEHARFDALKIAGNPTPAVVGGSTIPGIDGRFVMGITNYSGSCYFNSALQILLCDDDFIQLLITSICKPINEDEYTSKIRDKFLSSCINNTSDETKLESQAKVDQDAKDSYNVVTNFTEIFKTIIVSNPRFDITNYENIRGIVISDIVKTKQQDPQEVIQGFLGLFKCINNIYSNKIIDNLNFKKQVYTSNSHGGIVREKLKSEESILMINPYIEGKSNEEVNSMNITISQLIKDQKNINQFIELGESYYKKKGDADLLTKYNNLSNIIIKSGILYLMYTICTLGINNPNYNSILELIKKYNFSGSVTNPEKSYNEISKVIASDYFPTITSELTAIKQFIDKNKTSNIGLDINNISSICDNVKRVYTFLDSEFKDMSISKTDKNVEHTDIIEINEYFIVSINRSLPDQSKSSFNVNIESTLKIDIGEQSSLVESNYILQGYCVHLGKHSVGGAHWMFIKCDPKTGKESIVLDDSTISVYQPASSDTYQKGASLFIYKQEGIQAGGGFKPRHNATATHTTSASKSRHNSSFKASSSSKSKTKTKNRSHTQRVK